MRRLSMWALIAVCAVSACKSAGTRTNPPGQVTMNLQCLADGGFSFSLSPLSVTLPAPDAGFTWVNDPSSNVEGVIASQNPQFPFGNASFRAKPNEHAVGKPVPHTPKGTYKYTVTATCPDGHKVIIDPDMIIPWSTQ